MIVCVGSISQDIFFPTDEGEIWDTPEDLTSKQKIAFEVGGKYRVNDRYEAVGGVAANVAQGLARQGHEVACYSTLGGDQIGEWILQELRQAGVMTERLTIDSSVRSDLSAIIVMEATGDRTIFHNRDANERLQIISEKLLPADWFFVSALNGPWEDNLRALMRVARESGVRIAYNPGQHNIRDNAALVLEMIALAEVLVLNKDEAIELLLDKSAPRDFDQSEEALLRALHEHGARRIGLTDGQRGAWASDGEQILHVPSTNIEKITDATGGGDAFGSGFFGATLSGKDLAGALACGVANARSVIQEYGAAAGLLDLKSLDLAAAELEVRVLEKK